MTIGELFLGIYSPIWRLRLLRKVFLTFITLIWLVEILMHLKFDFSIKVLQYLSCSFFLCTFLWYKIMYTSKRKFSQNYYIQCLSFCCMCYEFCELLHVCQIPYLYAFQMNNKLQVITVDFIFTELLISLNLIL